MKKILLAVVVIGAMVVFGCSKSSNNVNACSNALPFDDSTTLKNFAGDSIPLTMDANTGLFYHIVDSGSSVKPNDNSFLKINYIGRLMSNKIFDSASNTNLNGHPLSDLILGWRIGLPKIGVGGRIKLFVPSDYAYGCTGYGPIPPNAPVFFDITLIAVQ